jgi:hypothetical protein
MKRIIFNVVNIQYGAMIWIAYAHASAEIVYRDLLGVVGVIILVAQKF